MSLGQFADLHKLSKLRRHGLEAEVRLNDFSYNWRTENEWLERLRAYDTKARGRTTRR